MQRLAARIRVCSECGSDNIEYDPVHESRFCHECGTVLEENEFV